MRLGRSPDSADAVAMTPGHNPTTGRSPEGEDEVPRTPRRPRAVAYASSPGGWM